jgi:hypothetical protein
MSVQFVKDCKVDVACYNTQGIEASTIIMCDVIFSL